MRYRFFTDPKRGDLPWREDWVRKLHREFKYMHWNSMRYTIGFPPEQWYRIADEEGLMIQDEFPLWCMKLLGPRRSPASRWWNSIQWMRERWNHPSVAIWDAQNESVADASGVAHGLTEETGRAIVASAASTFRTGPGTTAGTARSSRATVTRPTPTCSAIGRSKFADFATLSGAPGEPGGLQCAELPNTHQNPIIIDEYGWGHLRRDGELTDPSFAKFYQDLPWKTKTIAERQELHARVMAAETEFWRAKRRAAGVLHFCGLCYSKPKVATSDHFVDIAKLNLEPYFAKYVRDAFVPVGLMIDFWGDQMLAGSPCTIPVVVVNDLDEAGRLHGPFFNPCARGSRSSTWSRGVWLPSWARPNWSSVRRFPPDSARINWLPG